MKSDLWKFEDTDEAHDFHLRMDALLHERRLEERYEDVLEDRMLDRINWKWMCMEHEFNNRELM